MDGHPKFCSCAIGWIWLVLESGSGPEPSWGHHEELNEIGMLQIQVLCPAVCSGYPCSPSGGKLRATLAPFNTFIDKTGKSPCFGNLFVLCEEVALPWDALRQRDEDTWHKFPSPVQNLRVLVSRVPWFKYSASPGWQDWYAGVCLEAVTVSGSHRPLARWCLVPRYCCDWCSNKYLRGRGWAHGNDLIPRAAKYSRWP